MSAEYTVHDEPDFARVYTEDEMVQVRLGDLRALLDIATQSLDFSSGFLNNEDIEVIRSVARVVGVDPDTVTPSNFICQYKGEHAWYWNRHHVSGWRCRFCNNTDKTGRSQEQGPPT